MALINFSIRLHEKDSKLPTSRNLIELFPRLIQYSRAKIESVGRGEKLRSGMPIDVESIISNKQNKKIRSIGTRKVSRIELWWGALLFRASLTAESLAGTLCSDTELLL